MPDCGAAMLWCADAVLISFTPHADVFSVAQRQNHIMNSFADYLTRCGASFCHFDDFVRGQSEVEYQRVADQTARAQFQGCGPTEGLQGPCVDLLLPASAVKAAQGKPNCMCSPQAVTGEDSPSDK
jgi:hypothetical protein